MRGHWLEGFKLEVKGWRGIEKYRKSRWGEKKGEEEGPWRVDD